MVGLLRTCKGVDSISVIIDLLTDSAYFLPIQSSLAPRNWLVSTFGWWFNFMDYQFLLYQIGVLSSHRKLEGPFRKSWELGLILAWLSTYRLMVSRSVLFRSLSTCCGLVFWSLVIIGTSSCLWRSLHTTTATILESRRPFLKPSIVALSDGMV